MGDNVESIPEAAAVAPTEPFDPRKVVNTEFLYTKLAGSMTICFLLLADGTLVMGFDRQDPATFDYGEGQRRAREAAEAQIQR